VAGARDGVRGQLATTVMGRHSKSVCNVCLMWRAAALSSTCGSEEGEELGEM